MKEGGEMGCIYMIGASLILVEFGRLSFFLGCRGGVVSITTSTDK